VYSRGISAIGSYLPSTRVEKADIYQAHAWALPGLKGKSRGWRSAARWDQDIVTMAVEAARRATRESGRESIKELSVASTSHPFKDRSSASIASAALNLPTTVFATDQSSSRRAGTSALLKSLLEQTSGQHLVIAAEKRIAQAGSWAEISWGDGAAAVVTDDENPIAQLIGWHSLHEDSIDFYWSDGFMPYQGEERWIKETMLQSQVVPTVQAALEKANTNPADVDWAVLCEPVPGCEKQLLRSLKLENATPITQQFLLEVGDLGAALPLAGLCMAIEKAKVGDTILVTGFGNGCDALVFKMLQPIDESKKALESQMATKRAIGYTAFATSRNLIDLDYGPRSERIDKTALSVHGRLRKDITAFIGGKTTAEGAVQFPKSPIAANGSFSNETGYIDVCLADLEATVVSITTDHLSYCPDPPFYFGLVEFENGARLPMEFADLPPEGLAVGDTVRMEFRIKSIDRARGYRHYFWKATALNAGGTA
jgi:hydroxymethylglutaryl-CoA synthase